MKTIRIEKTNKEVPSPYANPITLHATEDSNFSFGDIRYIKTGIRFYFPVDIQKTFESMVPGIVIIGNTQPEPDGCLQLIVLCCSIDARIGRGQMVAKLSLFEEKPIPVRFAEFSDGKRMVLCDGIQSAVIDSENNRG